MTAARIDLRLLSTFLVLILVALLIASFNFSPQTAHASGQRVVLAELFTATWCTYCPYATQGINTLANEYGQGNLVVLQYHPSDNDVFGNAETDARVSYYGIEGFPTMIFDGANQDVGGSDETYNGYKTKIDGELAKTSDVSISFSGSMTDFTAKVALSSSAQQTSAKVRFVVYEDNIPYDAANGETSFQFTVRTVLNEEAVTLIPGQTVLVHRVFQPQASWNSNNLGLAVFVQRDETKEVLQAALYSKPAVSFSLSCSGTAKTVQAEQTTNFTAVITNTCSSSDSYNLTLTKFLPSGWLAGFCTENICYWDSATINLDSGASQTINIYIVSSDTPGTGKVTFAVASQTDPTLSHSVTTPDLTLSASTSSPTPSPSPTVPETTSLLAMATLAIAGCAIALAVKEKKIFKHFQP